MIESCSLWLVSVLVLLLTAWVVQRRRKQKILQSYGFLGPQPSFIMGNFMGYIKNNVNYPTELIQKYGDVCHFYVGTRPLVIIANLDMVHEIFITHSSNFRNRPNLVLGKIYPIHDSLLDLQDDRWKTSRHTLSPTFSAAKMKSMITLMDRPVETFIEKISEFCDQDKSFDMYYHTEAMTLEVIGRCAFGSEMNCQRDLNDPFFNAIINFMKYTRNIMMNFGLIFPEVESLVLLVNQYFMPAGYRAKKAVKRLRKFIRNRKLISEDHSKHGRIPKDLLRLMTVETSKLTEEEVIGNAFGFVIAGFETTAAAISFTFHLLAQHQDIQQQLYEYIVEKIPEEQKLSYDDVMFGFPYLDNVFNESLRFYPPVAMFTMRECSEECSVGGYTIPKGCGVFVPTYHIHHNPDYWPDPEVFDPSRFSEENKPNIKPQSFLPFGIGPRNCIGMRFAQMEAKKTIVEVLRKFKFVFCSKTQNPPKIMVPNVTLYPIDGIHLKAVRR